MKSLSLRIRTIRAASTLINSLNEADLHPVQGRAAWAAKEAKLDAIREKKAAEAAEKAAFEEKVKLKRQQSMAAF